MKKKAIPALITIMLVALIGITFIQVKWINNSIHEKQSYIDNLVQQAVVNVDNRLSDLQALTIFHNQTNVEITDTDSLIIITEFDSLLPIVHLPQPPVWNSANASQLQIIHQNDSSQIKAEITTIHEYSELKDSVKFELHAIQSELNQLQEVRTIIDKIKFEKDDHLIDLRLDSVTLAKEIKHELSAFNLDTFINFGVYDLTEKSYKVNPSDSLNLNYQIPLFKNDFIEPGRYVLHLSLLNNQNIIWQDIKAMVALSALFILIILAVFLYAVKLILKHKKISEIKSDFINNMTHEFKTPLATISLATDSILHEKIVSQPEKIQYFANVIREEKNKLNENVERILEIAKLEKGHVNFTLEKVDIRNCILQATEDLALLNEEKNGVFEIHCPQNLFFDGNTFHFTKALKNLFENGIKYCIQNPSIKISVQEKNNAIIIDIVDNGIGMTHEQTTKIFDPFYRVQSGNIHNNKGFGLGLSYCYYIIKQMEGDINVYSKPNEGTHVEIKMKKHES